MTAWGYFLLISIGYSGITYVPMIDHEQCTLAEEVVHAHYKQKYGQDNGLFTVCLDGKTLNLKEEKRD